MHRAILEAQQGAPAAWTRIATASTITGRSHHFHRLSRHWTTPENSLENPSVRLLRPAMDPSKPGLTRSRAERRTYRPWRNALLAGAALAALTPWAEAANLFNSRPLDASRFAVLARPLGRNDWNLLVLEQIQPQPRCWEERPDGLIDPALNRFNYTGICSRYLDSNGYSLRIGDQDLASRYRLQLRQSGNELQLQASTPSDPTTLVVARAKVPLRDRDGFVSLKLEAGWDLQRRSFGEQTLNHLYFANAAPLPQLLAAASGISQPPARPGAQLGLRPPVAPPNLLAQGTGQGPIRLPVIPFRD